MWNELFAASPGEQVRNVAEWSAARGWGFETEPSQLAVAAAAQPPTTVVGELTVNVLVPYLGDAEGIVGVQRTFDELWTVVRKRLGRSWRSGYARSDQQDLALYHDTHVPGLAWEQVDLSAHWRAGARRSPRAAREAAQHAGIKLAHAGVLAAAAHFPGWVRAMDGSAIPFVEIAGYVCDWDGDPGEADYVPVVRWDPIRSRVELDIGWVGYELPRWSIPTSAPAVLASSSAAAFAS
jgi:hypothetical protein